MAWGGFCLLIKWKNFYRGNKRQQCNLIYCLFYIALLRLGYKPDKKEHKMMGKWRVNSAPLKYSSFFFPFPCSSGHCQWPTSHDHTDVTLTAPSAKLDSEILAEGNCPGHTWDVSDVLRAKPSSLHTHPHMPSAHPSFSSSCDIPASGTHRSQSWSSPASVQSYFSLTFVIMTFVSRSCKHEINFENQ